MVQLDSHLVRLMAKLIFLAHTAHICTPLVQVLEGTCYIRGTVIQEGRSDLQLRDLGEFPVMEEAACKLHFKGWIEMCTGEMQHSRQMVKHRQEAQRQK